MNTKAAIYQPRREARNPSFPHRPFRNQPYHHLELGLLASRTVRQQICNLRHQLWYVLLREPSKLICYNTATGESNQNIMKDTNLGGAPQISVHGQRTFLIDHTSLTHFPFFSKSAACC